MSKLIIAGVNINVKDSKVTSVKTLEDVKKLDLFSHLPEKEKDAAELKLLSTFSVNTEEKDSDREERQRNRLNELLKKDPSVLSEEEARELE